MWDTQGVTHRGPRERGTAVSPPWLCLLMLKQKSIQRDYKWKTWQATWEKKKKHDKNGRKVRRKLLSSHIFMEMSLIWNYKNNILSYFYFSVKSDVQILQCIQENKENAKNRVLSVVSSLHSFKSVFAAWWWKEIPYPPVVNLQIPGSSIFLRKNIQIEATPATSNHLVCDKIKALKTETSLHQVN